MSANIESASYSNQPAWHREGTVIDTNGDLGMSAPQALETSGLDWTVEMKPVFIKDGRQQIEIEDKYAVVRTTDLATFGVVSDKYSPVQNVDGFDIIEEFMQGGTAWIEAAGSLDGGKKVWILAHMTEDMQIAGETIMPYVLFTNGHDGRTSVTAAMTDIRVVCQNTLTMALDSTPRKINVRHTSRANERLAEAKNILGLRNLYSEELAIKAEHMVDTKITDGEFNAFLETLLPIKDDQEGRPSDTMITKRREQIRDIYTTAENLNNIRGTAWGAYNAVVEYQDFHRSFKDDNTAMRAQFGDNLMKGRAQELLLA